MNNLIKLYSYCLWNEFIFMINNSFRLTHDNNNYMLFINHTLAYMTYKINTVKSNIPKKYLSSS